jgi:hypothetical protein
MSKKRKNAFVNDTAEVVDTDAFVNDTAEVEEVAMVRNVSNAPHVIFGKTIVAGGEYLPTDLDMKDENGVKRIKNAVASGRLEWR